ncbi:hypothetical protein [Peptoniphilus mikwangii]|uniref:hypothetical protein n=1 Tax=Peptoniphilus mikwangii TaxID=1354300 RepID=UPI000409A381|nr:hypothetical protein [Peptoniphilus mikwangii]
MRFNVAIIGDGIGTIELYRSLREKVSEKFVITIDNINYPYALRKNAIAENSHKLQNFAQKIIKLMIISSPSIALNINRDVRYKVADGLAEFYDKFETAGDRLVLSDAYFKSYLEEKYFAINVKDVQILLNSINDFDFNRYIISELLKCYIGNEKNIFVMDISLCLIKEYFYELFPDKNFYFLDEFILEEINKLDVLKNNEEKSTVKYRVSAYRRGFYLSCEEIFKEDFSSVKEVLIDEN